jgi:alpha-D-xyloside xylohydrolase
MFRNSIYSLLVISFFMSSCSKHKVIEQKNGVEIHTKTQNMRVQFYSDNILRVLKWKPESTSEKKSLTINLTELKDVEYTMTKGKDSLTLETKYLRVVLDIDKLKISYYNTDGLMILDEGVTVYSPVVYGTDSAYSVRQNFILNTQEGIYGLGQHQSGYMNYRGKTVTLVQSNTEAVNPFFISTAGYGILWDNYSKTVYTDNGKSNASLWSDVADNIDYYFVGGESMDRVIAGYRYLTGKAPMYGKWAYGYWQSKEHYDTQAELMTVAEKYRRLKIPIDNMIQDWDYWNGAANWGGMFFDKTLFPNPDDMVSRLHSMNFHMIISIWPALGPNTEVYKEMESNGFLFKPVGWAGFKYYDAFNPAANQLYWKYLKKGLYSVGLDGWWIDSTEPDIVNALTKEATEYEMKKVGNNYLGSWARYLNAFSLVMTDDIYKYWRAETSDRRAYILTRSTYAGQQRNAATTWSGDIGASWEIYKNQIAAGLNHCMSGIPYWTFDIGAFVLGAYGGVFSNGGKDPSYQELYTRMFQLGTFTPIFRSHGSETPREIWEMGEFTNTLIKYDNLRYRLMPYIYSLAWKVTSDGYTIMRGLPMDFTADKNTYSINDEFMFGPSFLVCPVTEFMYHRPPEESVIIDNEYFKTDDDKPGLKASYYKDTKYSVPGKETTDRNINVFWYTGRPEYVTDSMFSIRWKGKIVPKETGDHQFHLKCFDAKRLIINGDTLKMVYTSVEQYSEKLNLKAGVEYSFVLETENKSTGAARMQLFWKTPSIFASEKKNEIRSKTRNVYLPDGNSWFDFWTGKVAKGGQSLSSPAPIDILPLYVKAGSIIPMGAFVQYATEKPDAPIEIRIYPGTNCSFSLYEDENDNYNYEKGIYSTIEFSWNEAERKLIIGQRKGEYPGMIKDRIFNIVIVKENHGTGMDVPKAFDKTVNYNGDSQIIGF